jgi:hypothetical protein
MPAGGRSVNTFKEDREEMVTENKILVSSIRNHFDQAHSLLEATLGEATDEQLSWNPPGKALPLGAQYAHAVFAEDGVVSGMLKGGPVLSATSWAGRTGVSEVPPVGAGWEDWARRVQVDLAPLREYAQAVYASTDQYLASLSDDDLDRPLDVSSLGLGQHSVGWMLDAMRQHVDNHCGEISCLKGLQGAKGYPG